MAEQSAAGAKPAMDEESFTQLLAAAYVMQEHQKRMKAGMSASQRAAALSQIIEAQHPQETAEGYQSEHANILAVLHRLKPQLQKLVEQTPERQTERVETPELCRACANEFIGNEEFCAVCGASRISGQYPGAELQSKWATLWERHLSGVADGNMPVFRKAPPKESIPHAEKLPFELEADDDTFGAEPRVSDDGFEFEAAGADDKEEFHPAKVEKAGDRIEVSPWVSASQAQKWLALRNPQMWWSNAIREVMNRPGDVSLMAATLVLVITLGWAFWPREASPALASAQPLPTTVKRRPRPEAPKLTLMEKTLVALGLAVPPSAPQYTGDPNVKVWEDPQNGLYYCPDADLYGTTPKGRYATQGEAQLDSFDPASHRFCD